MQEVPDRTCGLPDHPKMLWFQPFNAAVYETRRNPRGITKHSL
jgi:hypothetical protein